MINGFLWLNGGSMSFDTDPQDKHNRSLLCHQESDSLFEVFSNAERDNYLGTGEVDDVTGVEYWENEFKKSKK